MAEHLLNMKPISFNKASSSFSNKGETFEDTVKCFREYKSVLKPLISALAVKTGQLGSDSIWNTKINMFFDAIKRINKIQDATLLLQGAYSGFASLKNINRDRLDWMGEI